MPIEEHMHIAYLRTYGHDLQEAVGDLQTIWFEKNLRTLFSNVSQGGQLCVRCVCVWGGGMARARARALCLLEETNESRVASSTRSP